MTIATKSNSVAALGLGLGHDAEVGVGAFGRNMQIYGAGHSAGGGSDDRAPATNSNRSVRRAAIRCAAPKKAPWPPPSIPNQSLGWVIEFLLEGTAGAQKRRRSWLCQLAVLPHVVSAFSGVQTSTPVIIVGGRGSPLVSLSSAMIAS